MTDNLQPPLPSLRCFSLRKFTERGTHAIEIKTVVREIERDDGVFDDTAFRIAVFSTLKKGGSKRAWGIVSKKGELAIGAKTEATALIIVFGLAHLRVIRGLGTR